MNLEKLRSRWHDLSRDCDRNPRETQSVFAELVGLYSQPHRHYHTLTHVLHILETVDRHQKNADNFQAIQLAAWFHDAVYHPQATDNEDQSAAIARTNLRSLQIPDSQISKVADFILCTKTHQSDDPDAQILLDADLAILNAEPTQYWNYARSIRREYAWVSDIAYRAGRQQVLEKFLDRWERQTLYFLPGLEQRAGANLRSELRYLQENQEIF